jgi:hypothetical protein
MLIRCIEICIVLALNFNFWVEASAGGLQVPEGLYSPVVKYFGTCLHHIVWECPNVHDLLKRFLEFCQTKEIIVPLNPLSFIFGLNLKSTETYYIFLILKSYIGI